MENGSATTTLAWLTCLRDQPPDCQRATGAMRSPARGRRPPGARPLMLPTGRWPGGEAVRRRPRPAPSGAGTGPDRLRARAVDRSCRGGSSNPRGKPAGGSSVAGGRLPMRPSGASGLGPRAAPDAGLSKVILRKEVIQPQVPLRLPCYDLVPITGFIFGACLDGSGDFGCPPLWWLDGRCVQGSGTHSPRQC